MILSNYYEVKQVHLIGIYLGPTKYFDIHILVSTSLGLGLERIPKKKKKTRFFFFSVTTHDRMFKPLFFASYGKLKSKV